MSQGRLLAFSSMILASGLLLAGCSLPFGAKTPAQSGPQGKLDQAANAAKMSVMMATGQAGTCTITNIADTTAAQSEISIKGKKFRMKGSDFGGVGQPDSSEVTPAVKKMGYMLNDGEFIYFWQDQATTGMKMKLQPTPSPVKGEATETKDKPTSDDNQNPANQFESDPKYRIDCNLGSVTDDVFVAPKEVKFMDLSQALTFPGADKVPNLTQPAGKLPANAKMPALQDYPDVPTDLPADLNEGQ